MKEMIWNKIYDYIISKDIKEIETIKLLSYECGKYFNISFGKNECTFFDTFTNSIYLDENVEYIISFNDFLDALKEMKGYIVNGNIECNMIDTNTYSSIFLNSSKLNNIGIVITTGEFYYNIHIINKIKINNQSTQKE